MNKINNSTNPFIVNKELTEEQKQEIKNIFKGGTPTSKPILLPERSHNEAVGTGMYLLLLLNQMVSSYIDTADGYAKVPVDLIQRNGARSPYSQRSGIGRNCDH